MNQLRHCFLCAILLLQSIYKTYGFVRLAAKQRTPAVLGVSENGNEDFDPLLSPHAYPDGIDAGAKEVAKPTLQDRMYKPKKPFGITLPSNSDEMNMAPESNPTTAFSSSPDLFDPTLSPHMYQNGTPDAVIGDSVTMGSTRKSKVIGILLMDHGSKSDAANERLERLAAMYQQHPSSTKRIVRAAHMELASPSIRDGIQDLLEEGVDEIICHPYFLSPGRHVREDIPNLVKEAIESLDVQIPIVTTDPVGSNTAMMIQAIDSLVVSAQSRER